MAHYLFRTTNVSKAKQSAIAKAAYVSGEKIYSERDQEYKRFRKREEKPTSFILAPAHAPEWVYDRERLWNEAEKVEKPYNARVQREVLIALPIELTKEQNVELAKEYVEENFVSDGMVADVNIHYDKSQNPHAHILLTVRPFNEDGTWWKTKSKKEYLKDQEGKFILDNDGKKKSRKIDLTGWNDKDKLLLWRENLAEKINQKYKELGIDEQVTHLSYENSGSNKIAKQRLTRNEYYIEQKEKNRAIENGEEYVPVTTYGKLNAEIEKYNIEIQKLSNEIEELENEKLRIGINENKVIDIRDFIIQKQMEEKRSYSDEQNTAIQFVLDRSKEQEFNFTSIFKAEKSVNGWGIVLSKKVRELNFEKDLLEKISLSSKENPIELKKYGFNKADFINEYNKKVIEFKEKENNLAKEFEKYKTANNTIKVAKDTYYKELKILFDSIYPEHKLISKFKTNENMKVMDSYVNELLKNNIIKPVVEFEAYEELLTKEEHVFRTKTTNAIEEYKRYAPQYFGLNKRIELLEKQLLLNEREQNISYEEKLKIHVMKSELMFIKERMENGKTGMYNSLIELYGEKQKDVISKIPDKLKVNILNDFINKREVRELKGYIQNEKNNWNKDNQNQQNQQQGRAGDLLSELLAQSMMNQDKNNYDETNAKRRKKGYSKGYKTKDYERGY